MRITINNGELSVCIAAAGAEMQSLRDAEGAEYLWNGDAAYWAKRAPHLFPYIGRLTDGTYLLHRRAYRMDRHGFAARSVFRAEDVRADSAVFLMTDSGETRRMYPFRFALRVAYRLSGRRLMIAYTVENTGADTMYFGLGAHPGFALPLENGLSFEDYFLEFGDAAAPVRIGISDAGFRTGADTPFALAGGRRLALSHALFDRDAIVLSGMDKSVTVRSAAGVRALRVSYPRMAYLGLWHRPQTDAPYLCIEPWTSLPSREGVIEELSRQSDLIALPAGDAYRNAWTIDIL